MSFGRTDINVGAFASYLVGTSRALVRTYYYNCALPPDADDSAKQAQDRFFSRLHRTPYLEVRLGRLSTQTVKCRYCGRDAHRHIEKGVDMRIGIDLLGGAWRNLYDTAILVSGDADLSEAVRAVKEVGKHVELAALPSGRSWELVQVADLVREVSVADVAPFFLRKLTTSVG
jgi:uncharacterized LabA/DUF88 family protein